MMSPKVLFFHWSESINKPLSPLFNPMSLRITVLFIRALLSGVNSEGNEGCSGGINTHYRKAP